jgi:hypothetical protein
MTPSQPSPAPPAADLMGPTDAVVQAFRQDEDVALGFECAHPALQFERWGQDEATAHASS